MGIDETSFMNAYTEELPSSTEPAGDPGNNQIAVVSFVYR